MSVNQDMTARQLLTALTAVLKEEPEVADLPAVVIVEGRLLNVVSVDASTMHHGMLLLSGRDYDRPRLPNERPSGSGSWTGSARP